ncbi:MAG TPA: hypothetical protein VK469_16750 [Candidatus Kapabacteria bacterium]|nr:hypothetical protein [Candidatus Kapabacteria bacterium]
MKNKIVILTILITGIMGTCLPLQAAVNGLEWVGTWDEANIRSLFIDGNNAYIGYDQRFIILDISKKSAPIKVAEIPTTCAVMSVYISGKYAYVVDSGGRFGGPMPDSGLRIIDISTPRNPRQVGFYTNCTMDKCNAELLSIFVSGNCAYIATGDSSSGSLDIFDISNPSSPQKKGHHDCELINNFCVSGNYAYCAYFLPRIYGCSRGGLLVIDISSPVSPMGKSSLAFIGCNWVRGFDFFNGYAYVSNYNYESKSASLNIIDVINPGSPQMRHYYRTKGNANDVKIAGNCAFIADGSAGVSVLDISNLNEIIEVAYYQTPGRAEKIVVSGDFVYVADDSAGLLILKISTPLIKLHRITLDKTQLKYASTQNTPPYSQDVWVLNGGTGTINWSVSTDAGWLSVKPQSGKGNAILNVNADAKGLSAGTYNSTVTVTDPQALNGPQEVKVSLRVYSTETVSPPFGCFDTPIDGSLVSNSIPVCGWVLHDIGVQSVKIFLEEGWGEGKTPGYIGNAVFIEGARPDIETLYPDYPFSEKAGWGYMVLTNLFPRGGNGQFTLHAVAQTLDGQQVTLGKKAITCANALSENPFGDIYTPRHGDIISGSSFMNWGWAVTPMPNNIDTDGSTVWVFIDGVKIGHPVYNLGSPHIAKVFPGYANSERARGYFNLDTSRFANGQHNIQWVAIDSKRNMGGIGSRYFSILNSGVTEEQVSHNVVSKAIKIATDLDHIPGNYMEPLKIERGFRNETVDREIFPEADGICKVKINELEHIEILLGENITDIKGYLIINNQLRVLPIGSTLDTKTGKFYWSPGPGYFGRYELVFVIKDADNRNYKREIEINIEPLFNMR